MNHHTSTDDISRRAYELWEKEGRPEGCDLRHWLQAEQELNTSQPDNGIKAEPAAPATDIRPLQGTRAAAAVNRETRRGSNAPFSGERAVSNGNSQSAARRKPASAPAL
jgi:hypothetical protein